MGVFKTYDEPGDGISTLRPLAFAVSEVVQTGHGVNKFSIRYVLSGCLWDKCQKSLSH